MGQAEAQRDEGSLVVSGKMGVTLNSASLVFLKDADPCHISSGKKTVTVQSGGWYHR